ncbi:MAG: GrpB family protein [Oscillospiraceae bacterium]|jgi:GrpB-like predicted nucleotidyltransferase (UPF0157 family)|nr:GrpB family protein [Oscillospiraceae bacterium]MDD3261786.1 GrpB family protein [Oscillospiraceae bacterium]
MHTSHVTVVPYDVRWPAEFEKACRALALALGGSALSIEHVGSTAVPGLWAKPILDIDVVIPSMNNFSTVCRKLEVAGYRHEGDLGIPGREAFCYDEMQKPHLLLHHLYVCPQDSPELQRHILFREYLRAHPRDVKIYSAVKREGARRFPYDINAYLAYKTDCIETIYKKCGLL